MIYASDQFLESKDIVEIKFLMSANYSFNVIHIAAVSTELVVLICLCMAVSVFKTWVCCVFLFLCLCDIKSEYLQKATLCQTTENLISYLRQQGPSGAKVSRLDICRTIISLSNIAHQMWRDLPFSQRNKATKITLVVGFRGEGENWTKFESFYEVSFSWSYSVSL